MLGGAKPPISDRSARAVARGAQKAESEGGVLGEMAAS